MAPRAPDRSSGAGEAIIRLRSSDPAVRVEGIRRLAGLHFSEFDAVTAGDVAILAQALKAGDPESRLASAQAFSQLTHSERGAQLTRPVVGVVVAALKDPDATVASTAAIALGHSGDPAAIAPLIDALADPRPTVASSAAAAVGHFADQRHGPQLVSSLRYPSARNQLSAILTNMNPVPVAELVVAVESHDVELRRGAAYALARLGDQRVKGALTQALGDSDSEVRILAARGLRTVGDPSVAEPLARLLDDPDPRVRRAAAFSLRGTGGSAAAVDKLLVCLEDPDQEVRQEAMVSLARIGDSRAVEPLLALLRRPAPEPNRTLVEAVGHWKGNKEIIRGLIATLASDNEIVRRKAAHALTIDNGKVAVMGREAVLPLVAALKSPDVEVRRVSALSLLHLGSRGILNQSDAPSLAEAARDKDARVSRFAAAALAGIEQGRGAAPSR